jgi:hypothetical protein
MQKLRNYTNNQKLEQKDQPNVVTPLRSEPHRLSKTLVPKQ